MFIKADELERRREESNNLVERMGLRLDVIEPVVDRPVFDAKRFDQDGATKSGMPFEEKVVVGVAAQVIGPAKTAEIFGVSPSYATMLGKDKHKDEDLKRAIYAGLEMIREAAREKLLMALEGINPESLAAIKAGEKAKVSAQIANQLSSVIDRTIDKMPEGTERTTHLHLYAPETRPLAAFTIKRINSNPEQQDGEASLHSS